MQSKGAIKLLAVLLALACVYQLSFTFKTRSVEKKASEYAAQFPLDQQGEAEQHYLDSVQNLGVYNLGFKKFTYKECKEKEINLGLDLRGGMNVMLEISVEDVVRALSNDSKDPVFNQALAQARRAEGGILQQIIFGHGNLHRPGQPLTAPAGASASPSFAGSRKFPRRAGRRLRPIFS